MFRRARHRNRLGLLVVGCLLFQLFAVAAYACDLAGSPDPPPITVEHCSEMGMAPAELESPILCDQHCAPDLSLLTDTSAPGVPALAPAPAFAIVLAARSAHAVPHASVRPSRSDLPPRLRFCTLLI